MQSTGQTSTHAVSFVSIQGSVIMNGIVAFLRLSVRNFRTCDYPYVVSGLRLRVKLRRTALASAEAVSRTQGFSSAGPDGPAARYRHRLRARDPIANGRASPVHALGPAVRPARRP